MTNKSNSKVTWEMKCYPQLLMTKRTPSAQAGRVQASETLNESIKKPRKIAKLLMDSDMIIHFHRQKSRIKTIQKFWTSKVKLLTSRCNQKFFSTMHTTKWVNTKANRFWILKCPMQQTKGWLKLLFPNKHINTNKLLKLRFRLDLE